MSEDPPETVVHELIEFVRSNGGDGVVSWDHIFNPSDGLDLNFISIIMQLRKEHKKYFAHHRLALEEAVQWMLQSLPRLCVETLSR